MQSQDLQLFDATRVRSLLPMGECIEVMARAMRAISAGKVSSIPRTVMPLERTHGVLGLMPGACAALGLYGAKVLSLHPRSDSNGPPAVQGVLVVFEYESGTPVCVIDAAAVTAIRTAAASALATRTLARADARSLGILGCGVQAAAHIEAICSVRDIEEIRIWGRDHAKAEKLARAWQQSRAVAIEAVKHAEDAAASDIVCTVTAAAEPVLAGKWLRPGCHVNLVGSHAATTREADTESIARGRVYVDSLESALLQAGDLLIPIAEGRIDAGHIVGEIGQCLLRQVPGRQRDDDVTVYKSLGLVGQDLFAAHHLLERAR